MGAIVVTEVEYRTRDHDTHRHMRCGIAIGRCLWYSWKSYSWSDDFDQRIL